MGAVVFERPAHQHLVIGQKCRGQRIARKPAHVLAVEREIQRFGGIEEAAPCGETGAHAGNSVVGWWR